MNEIEAKRKELEKNNPDFAYWFNLGVSLAQKEADKKINELIEDIGKQYHRGREEAQKEFSDKINTLDKARMGDHQKWKELKQSLGEKS